MPVLLNVDVAKMKELVFNLLKIFVPVKLFYDP